MPKIVQLETFSNEFVCFVKVTSEDGYSGWGQTAPYNADITAQIFHRQVAPWALGHDCQDIPQLIDRIQRWNINSRQLSRPRDRWFGYGLWDMAGKRANKPVVELIGAIRERCVHMQVQ